MIMTSTIKNNDVGDQGRSKPGDQDSDQAQLSTTDLLM